MDTYCMVSLCEIPRNGKFTETESRIVIFWGWWDWVKQMGSYYLKGIQFQFGKMKEL